MNAERLHAVTRAIREETEDLTVAPYLDTLVSGLQGLANQPSDAGSQQQISDARSGLQRLNAAPSNSWPSSDRQIVDQLGVTDIMGDQLLQRVENVLSRNEMTPAVALDEITPIAEQVRDANVQLAGLVDGLGYFGINADEPRGDAEIVFTIPREAVHDDLGQLGDEFGKLWRILAPFQELVTGSRSGIPVESISSSAFGLELLAAPAFAFGVAKAVNEILSVYKNVLEIREARQRLKESGVPDDALSGVDDYANEAIAERNQQLAEELVGELPVPASIDEGRRNELAVEIRSSLNAIANRIDKGYDIDVRAPNPPDQPAEGDEGENGSPDELANVSFQRQIRELSPQLRAEHPGGASILTLPEGPTEDET